MTPVHVHRQAVTSERDQASAIRPVRARGTIQRKNND
jgi:hypothetical protein